MGLGGKVSEYITGLLNTGKMKQKGSVIFIGVQQFYLKEDQPEMVKTAKLFDPDPPFDDMELSTFANAGFAHDFFRRVGMNAESTDLDPNATLRMDFNSDEVPTRFRNKFDLALNLGTSEHVPNQINVMKIIHDFVKPGGWMIHSVPFTGHMQHGIFNYQPKSFELLAEANGYFMQMQCLPGASLQATDPPQLENSELYQQAHQIPNLMLDVAFKKIGDLELFDKEDSDKSTFRLPYDVLDSVTETIGQSGEPN